MPPSPMNLNKNQLAALARSMVKAMTDAGDIEVTNAREVERDLESVLASYLEQVDRVASRARELTQQRGLPQGEFGRIKALAAEQAGIKVGEDALDFVLEQLTEMLMRSANVEEVFAADHQLRARIRPFIVAEDEADAKLEAEVKGRLKHVQEGSRAWEIEYARIKDEIRRRRGT